MSPAEHARKIRKQIESLNEAMAAAAEAGVEIRLEPKLINPVQRVGVSRTWIRSSLKVAL